MGQKKTDAEPREEDELRMREGLSTPRIGEERAGTAPHPSTLPPTAGKGAKSLGSGRKESWKSLGTTVVKKNPEENKNS